MEKLLQQIAKISPEIWHAAVRQQYIKGFVLIFFMMLGTMTIFFVSKDEVKEDNDKIIKGIVILMLTVVIFVLGFYVCGVFINPEYFAYRSLLP